MSSITSDRGFFGPAQARVKTRSARSAVKSTPVASFAVMLKLLGSMLPARLSGGYRGNPLFEKIGGQPIKLPQVLTAAELARLRDATQVV